LTPSWGGLLPSGGMLSPKPLFRRSFIAGALVLALLLPAAPSWSAGEAAALERTRQQITEIKKRIAAAKGQEAAMKKEVAALDGQIAEVARQIRKGEHDISSLEADIRSAEQKIAELESKYRTAANASNQRARRIYMAGPADAISRILSAKSIAEFVRLQVLWEVSSEIDGRTMLNASRVKAELQDTKADLDRIRGDLGAQRDWLRQRKGLVEDAKSDKTTALGAVQKDIAEQESHVRSLEQASRQLTTSLRSSSVSKSTGSVSRSGFIWPISGRVMSEFGRRWGGFHSGIDIDGETGDPIKASKSGTIAGVSCGGGYGVCTVIDHGNGVTTLYAHMTRKAVSGGSVSQGQVIGYVGCTGSCTGSHLHFEVRVNGSPQNPRNFLS